MIGSVTPPGVAAWAAAASQIRPHDSIDAPYTVIVAMAPFRRKSRREIPAVAPSSTARGIGTRWPWRRNIAARCVVCQSLQPQAVIESSSVGWVQERKPSGPARMSARSTRWRSTRSCEPSTRLPFDGKLCASKNAWA